MSNGGIIYELAIVEDRGSHWKVNNVTKNTLDGLANRNEQLLKLSYVSYKQISDALMSGKEVRISKTLATDEVLPWEIEVFDINNSADELTSQKTASICKIRMLITPEIAKISGLTLYGFIVLNNDLITNGFTITNQNREEQYLKILETGDEALISKLEDYLNYRDEIERVASFERKFSKFKNKINDATSNEEVKQTEQEFLEQFYSHY